jgi:AcrR family transcriptional regulator
MKKGDAKRQAILATAYRLFREKGFEQTSMSEITTQVGGSKATLYSHFTSKEDLFVACLASAIEYSFTGALASLDIGQRDVEEALRHFGIGFLSFITSDDMISARRLIISESSRLGVGELFLDKIRSIRDQVADFLLAWMDAGKLRRSDPTMAAEYLRGLLEARIVEPLLLQAAPAPSTAEVAVLADGAIDVFLRSYAPKDSHVVPS